MLIRRLLPVTILLVLALAGAPAQDIEFLVIDNDSIKAGEAPNFFTDQDVNTDVVDIGQRMQLRFFASHVTRYGPARRATKAGLRCPRSQLRGWRRDQPPMG